MYKIGLEDLAANAFIETIKRDGDVNRFISYAEIDRYGEAVLKELQKKW